MIKEFLLKYYKAAKKLYLEYHPFKKDYSNALYFLKICNYNAALEASHQLYIKEKREEYLDLIFASLSFEHNVGASNNSNLFKYIDIYFDDILENKKLLLYIIRANFDLHVKFIKPKKIIELINIYLNKYGDNYEVYYYLGMINEFIGNYENAFIFYKKSNSLCDNFINANFRVWYLIKTKKIKGHSDNYLLPVKNLDKIKTISYLDLPKLNKNKLLKVQQETLIKIENVFDPRYFRKSKEDIINFLQTYNYYKQPICGYREAPEFIKSFLNKELINKYLMTILNTLSKKSKKGWVPYENPAWWLQNMEKKHKSKTRPLGIPTSPHQDNPVYSNSCEWYTFWVPFDKVGKGIAPTLAVLNHKGILLPLDTTFYTNNRINSVDRKFIFKYFEKNMTVVSANFGDVIVFGRNMLHWTHLDNDMKQSARRIGLDLRWFVGTNYDV